MKTKSSKPKLVDQFLQQVGGLSAGLTTADLQNSNKGFGHIEVENFDHLSSIPSIGQTLAIKKKDLPWVAKLIYQCRVDLQEAFNLNTERGLFEFTVWLLRSANELNVCLVDDPEFIEFCSRKLFASSSLSILEATVYLTAEELQARWTFPVDEQGYRVWFADTFRRTGSGGIAEIAKVHLGEKEMPHGFFQLREQQRGEIQTRPFGVNIIGYAYGQLGIGEDARMTAHALEKLGIPHCLVNFQPGQTIPQNDFSLHHKVVEEGPYQINLFCMTATETARHFCFNGSKQWLGRHNIAYWPWELDKWPKNWTPVNRLIDEVWVASQHILNALKPSCDKPVSVVPLHVELGPVSPLTRKDFALPEQAKLFCFSFDLHSSLHRKNPQDCIKAFLDSFPKDDPRYTRNSVGLVIKTHRPSRVSREWEELKKLSQEDDRIHIIEHTLSRPDLLALYRCCDCFISLHRAEGFGRGIAEAILLGLEVVTTNYSGNLEFCRTPQCTLVDCELIPVNRGEYIEHKGMKWGGNFKLPKLDSVRRRFPT